MSRPFQFMSMAGLVRSAGRSASDLAGLRAGIAAVPDASIHYHLHHALLRRHFQAAEILNDFARWAGEELGDHAAAERLGAVDPVAVPSLLVARRALLDALDRSIEIGNGRSPARAPFHFAEVVTFILPTGIEATDVRELLRGVEKTDLPTIFVHFIEASVASETNTSDFSRWLRMRSESDLADQVDLLTPTSGGLRGVRAELIRILSEAVSSHTPRRRP